MLSAAHDILGQTYQTQGRQVGLVFTQLISQSLYSCEKTNCSIILI